jgi:preprotein translocase subunit SecE
MNGFVQKVKDFFRNIFDFVKETRKELKNVSWPTQRELTGTTLVVIIAVFFFGFFLWAVDVPANYVVHKVLQLLSP